MLSYMFLYFLVVFLRRVRRVALAAIDAGRGAGGAASGITQWGPMRRNHPAFRQGALAAMHLDIDFHTNLIPNTAENRFTLRCNNDVNTLKDLLPLRTEKIAI